MIQPVVCYTSFDRVVALQPTGAWIAVTVHLEDLEHHRDVFSILRNQADMGLMLAAHRRSCEFSADRFQPILEVTFETFDPVTLSMVFDFDRQESEASLPALAKLNGVDATAVWKSGESDEDRVDFEFSCSPRSALPLQAALASLNHTPP